MRQATSAVKIALIHCTVQLAELQICCLYIHKFCDLLLIIIILKIKYPLLSLYLPRSLLMLLFLF